jgi:hypothetical protein
MVHVSAAALAAALKGAKFPASTDDLVQLAQKNDAPKEVVEAIRNLPDKFYTMADVERAFSKEKAK